MSDYKLIIRVKNNLLHELMKSKGIESQAELSRAVGVSQIQIGKIANLREGAYGVSGSLSLAAEKLCNYFCCLPEDIFPKEVLFAGIPNNIVERVVSSKEVANYLEHQKADDTIAEIENDISNNYLMEELKRLPDRERRVIVGRYIDERTFNDIGDELGITRERVQQIERKALGKLRDIGKHLKTDSKDNYEDARDYFEQAVSARDLEEAQSN